MAIITYSASLGAASWISWRADSWQPGISPVAVYDPILGGFIFQPASDAQLLHFTSGPLAGSVLRLMGTNLSVTGNFADPNPLPLTGTITGFRIYDRYEDLLVFDDPNNQILTNSGQVWNGLLLAEATGLAVNAASLQGVPNLAAALFAAFAGGPNVIAGSSGTDVIEGGPSVNLVSAGDGNDRFTGIGGADSVGGGAGNDTLLGNGGNDVLAGEGGADLIGGGAGTDALYGGDGNDSVYGGDGDDVLLGGAGDDRLFGGSGLDYASFTTASGGVRVSLAVAGPQAVGGGEGTDALQGIEGLIGSSHADTLTGDAGNNLIAGGAGNDRIDGGAGDDRMNGGLGFDTLNYFFATAGVTVNLAAQGVAQAVGGGQGTDTFQAFEFVFGSGTGGDRIDGDGGRNFLRGFGGNDLLRGQAGADTLQGDAGDDTLGGGSGDDLLFGGAGNDALYGGDGIDRIDGGIGADTLFGGSGADVFVYAAAAASTTAARDVIADFAQGTDRIDLAAMDANTGLAGKQGWSFIGTVGFSAAGQLRAVTDGARSWALGDSNGDGIADFNLQVDGVTALTAADFILA
jgi:Ca2+-binding RTX toxin-like protein